MIAHLSFKLTEIKPQKSYKPSGFMNNGIL